MKTPLTATILKAVLGGLAFLSSAPGYAAPPGVTLKTMTAPKTGAKYTLAVVDSLRDPGDSPKGREESRLAKLLLERSDEAVLEHERKTLGDDFKADFFEQLVKERAQLKSALGRVIVFQDNDPTKIVRVLGVVYPDQNGTLPYRKRFPQAPPEFGERKLESWQRSLSTAFSGFVMLNKELGNNFFSTTRMSNSWKHVIESEKKLRWTGLTYEIVSFLGLDPLTLGVAYHALEAEGLTSRPISVSVGSGPNGEPRSTHVHPSFYRVHGPLKNEARYRFMGFQTVFQSGNEVLMEISRQDWVLSAPRWQPYAGVWMYALADPAGSKVRKEVLHRLTRWKCGQALSSGSGTPESAQ